MKKNYLLLFVLPKFSKSQCASTTATGCQCTSGVAMNCDLVPDISIARLPLTQSGNYTEYPQVCFLSCNGNDGRLRLGVSTPIIVKLIKIKQDHVKTQTIILKIKQTNSKY